MNLGIEAAIHEALYFVDALVERLREAPIRLRDQLLAIAVEGTFKLFDLRLDEALRAALLSFDRILYLLSQEVFGLFDIGVDNPLHFGDLLVNRCLKVPRNFL